MATVDCILVVVFYVNYGIWKRDTLCPSFRLF